MTEIRITYNGIIIKYLAVGLQNSCRLISGKCVFPWRL